MKNFFALLKCCQKSDTVISEAIVPMNDSGPTAIPTINDVNNMTMTLSGLDSSMIANEKIKEKIKDEEVKEQLKEKKRKKHKKEKKSSKERHNSYNNESDNKSKAYQQMKDEVNNDSEQKDSKESKSYKDDKEFMSPKFHEYENLGHKNENNTSNAHMTLSLSHIKSQEQRKPTDYSMVSFSNFQIKETNSFHESAVANNKLMLSGELFWNKELILYHYGLQNGLRKKQDNQAFFGLFNSKDYTGTFYNDLVLNFADNKNINNSSTGRVFSISFLKKSGEYQLYMIHNSLVLHYQIENYYYFEQDKDYYLMLGKVFMTIGIKSKEKMKIINVKIEREDEPMEEFDFNQNDAPISIGRINCNINVKSTCISKNHSIIEFSEACNMFYYKDLGSTNGSILLIREDDTLKLKGNMKCKLNDIPFNILELP